jgi:hypothetical protein
MLRTRRRRSVIERYIKKIAEINVLKLTYSHREGGRGVGEPVRRYREALVHKRGRKYQHD